MGSAESSNNSLLFLKYGDHIPDAVTILGADAFIPKVSLEMGGILKFQHVHKSPSSSDAILSKYDSYLLDFFQE